MLQEGSLCYRRVLCVTGGFSVLEEGSLCYRRVLLRGCRPVSLCSCHESLKVLHLRHTPCVDTEAHHYAPVYRGRYSNCNIISSPAISDCSVLAEIINYLLYIYIYTVYIYIYIYTSIYIYIYIYTHIYIYIITAVLLVLVLCFINTYMT